MRHSIVYNVQTYYQPYHSKTIHHIVCGINATPNGAILAHLDVLRMRTFRHLAEQINLHHVLKSACTLELRTTQEATASSTSTRTSHSRVVMYAVSIMTHRHYDQSKMLHQHNAIFLGAIVIQLTLHHSLYCLHSGKSLPNGNNSDFNHHWPLSH